MAADAEHRPEIYVRLGVADCRFAVEILDPPHPVRCFGLVLDGYDVRSEGQLDDLDAFGADVVLSGTLEAWTDMVDAIAAHGSADRSHTLNALSIAGFPLSARSTDPLGRDKFYRYAETLQTLFDSVGSWTAVTSPPGDPKAPSPGDPAVTSPPGDAVVPPPRDPAPTAMAATVPTRKG